MIYARPFFDLQLRFAGAVMALSGQPLARVLLEYTNLYARFGLGRDFDPAHPTWRQYVAGLPGGDELGEWTYRFYVARPEVVEAPHTVASFGCFAYARRGDQGIRLHFRNAETQGRSPLGVERAEARRADLAALFADVRRTMPAPPRVVGASWLYNLAAYRRLFPPPYVATARVIRDRFRHLPLWGQFVGRDGGIKEGVTRQFLERLERQRSLEDLDGCFPLQVLGVEASAREFYRFYGV